MAAISIDERSRRLRNDRVHREAQAELDRQVGVARANKKTISASMRISMQLVMNHVPSHSISFSHRYIASSLERL